jgi:hypothetical protein
MRGIVATSARTALVTALALVLASVSASACTSASGEVRGGGPRPGYDAAAPEPLVVPVTEDRFEGAGMTTWRGLYRDFFGRHSPASCAANGQCHELGREGTNNSGFACGDVDQCWDSLRHTVNPDPTKKDEPALVADADVASPEGARLFEVIRFIGKDGTLHDNKGMPRVPREYTFSPNEIDRMQVWIRNGAKND